MSFNPGNASKEWELEYDLMNYLWKVQNEKIERKNGFNTAVKDADLSLSDGETDIPVTTPK